MTPSFEQSDDRGLSKQMFQADLSAATETESAHMGNLYHIMNMAFLLIEEEREQYLDMIDRAKDQGIRSHVVSLHAICGVFRRHRSSLKRWAFYTWYSNNVQRQELALREKENGRRLEAAKNAINRMRSGLLLRVFKAWVMFLNLELRNKQILQAFTKKLLMRGQLKSIERWKEYSALRKRLRGIVNRCIGGKSMSLLSAGFRTLRANTLDAGKFDDLEAAAASLRQKLDDLTKR